ncbi:MAG: replicative DNA helicase, partial [Aeromonas hydrophila]
GRISAVESVQADGAVSILDCLEEVVADLESSFRGDDNENAITLGLPDIDQALGGVNPTDMIVVGGRPSHGKTTVLTTICEHMSVHHNYPVLIFSLEMSRKQLAERMMFHLAKARKKDVLGQTQMNSDEAWGRVGNAIGAMTGSTIMIDDRGRMTINDIRAEARRVAKKYGKLRAIMIDYIQLIDTSGAPTQLQGVSDISKGIKRLCKELETPVIALSQLSRDVEKRVNKRPVNSDLRESGQIEQDADLIFMVYNEEKYDPLTPLKGITELICTKSRHVPGAEKAYRFVNTHGGLDPLSDSFATQSRGAAQELEL